MNTQKLYILGGGVRHYPWGQRASDGNTPFIPEFIGCSAGEEPWAELWLGVHPSLPSILTDKEGHDISLSDAIAEAPVAWLGKAAAANAPGGTLPYLLKVLSCSHPLSIQSHPDAETACKLHAEHPELYPDANDKTEIIIALSTFQAMSGLRAAEDIEKSLAAHPSMRHLADAMRQNDTGKADLKALCAALFAMDADRTAAMLKELQEEIAICSAPTQEDLLFIMLLAEYPGDRGAIFAYLLNNVTLQPGEALFLEPNTLHAYMNGTGIECMSNSDNVIRAGLTGKAVDVPTLLATVDFNKSGAGECKPEDLESGVIRYAPATPKFRLTAYMNKEIELAKAGDTFAMAVILQGEAAVATPDGEFTVQRGEILARPAAAVTGSIRPLTENTIIFWVDTAY